MEATRLIIMAVLFIAGMIAADRMAEHRVQKNSEKDFVCTLPESNLLAVM